MVGRSTWPGTCVARTCPDDPISTPLPGAPDAFMSAVRPYSPRESGLSPFESREATSVASPFQAASTIGDCGVDAQPVTRENNTRDTGASILRMAMGPPL